MFLFFKFFKKKMFLAVFINISKGHNSLKNRPIYLIFFYFFKKNCFCGRFSHISKGHNSLKNCPIYLIFFSTCSECCNEVFLFIELYQILINMRHKCQKTEFFGGHLGFLAAILNFRFGSGQNLKALGLPHIH